MNIYQNTIFIRSSALFISAAVLLAVNISAIHFHEDGEHSDCHICLFLLNQADQICSPYFEYLKFRCLEYNRIIFNNDIIHSKFLYITYFPNAPPSV
ncbi:MAG: hypothetical protein MUC95_07465 [Spirochaetes bacterium]|nr:hypothetical protein [Spirochaetota bacterium]